MDERVWAIYAATSIEANLVCINLDIPVGTRVLMFWPGKPKLGHRFDRIYIKLPVITWPRMWDWGLDQLRLGLRRDGDEIVL